MSNTQTRTTNLRNLIAACAAITVFGFAFGITYPLLSLILESRGVSSDMIGINASMMPLGILVFSPVIPALVKRYGARRVGIAAALITGFLTLSFKLFDNLAAWFLIRLLEGMAVSILYVLSEAWIVGSANDKNRGLIVAIYSSALATSFALGPLLIGAIGIDGWLPFVIGSSVISLGTIPLLFIREEAAPIPEETNASGILDFAPKAPVLLAAVGVFAIFDAATLSLFPVYGMQNGLDIATSANILTALFLGNAFLQLPIGWLCDNYPHRHILASCAFFTAIFLMLIPLTVDSSLKWPLLVMLGATAYGVYTVSLTSLGDRFTGIELVNGSAAFAVIWGIGALSGSMAGGWTMLVFGSHALPVSLAITYMLLVLGLIWRAKTRAGKQTS